jgi:hypothetical protein
MNAPAEALPTCTPSGIVLVKNFALMYIEMGFERNNDETKLACIVPLLQGLSKRPVNQQQLLMNIFLTVDI